MTFYTESPVQVLSLLNEAELGTVLEIKLVDNLYSRAWMLVDGLMSEATGYFSK